MFIAALVYKKMNRKLRQIRLPKIYRVELAKTGKTTFLIEQIVMFKNNRLRFLTGIINFSANQLHPFTFFRFYFLPSLQIPTGSKPKRQLLNSSTFPNNQAEYQLFIFRIFAAFPYRLSTPIFITLIAFTIKLAFHYLTQHPPVPSFYIVLILSA